MKRDRGQARIGAGGGMKGFCRYDEAWLATDGNTLLLAAPL